MSRPTGPLTPSESGAAEALFKARSALKPIGPIRDTFGIEDPISAYRIQNANTEKWLAAGRRLVGRKIGLTSKAVQSQFGIAEPDFGMLWGDLAFKDGDTIPLRHFMQPRVEAEIAFILSADLIGPTVSMRDLMSSVAYCLPAIEIVDSAIDKWNIQLVDTIADNASSGGFVLGLAPRQLDRIDLRLCGMLMKRRGETVSTGVGAACLGHPLNAALWLAQKMVEVGRALRAGDTIMSGAVGPMVAVSAGDAFSIEIQGFDRVDVAFD